jgi:putative membrane protein
MGCQKTREVAGEGTTAARSEAEKANLPGGGAPSDANIVAVLKAANEAEIAAGQMASDKAADPQVKTFAQEMVTDHSKAEEQVTGLGVQPAESQDSKDLESAAQKESQELSRKSGPDFDKAYVEAQIDDHKAVLRKIDYDLMPNANEHELKVLLTELRPHVQQHLEKAQELKDSLKG